MKESAVRVVNVEKKSNPLSLKKEAKPIQSNFLKFLMNKNILVEMMSTGMINIQLNWK